MSTATIETSARRLILNARTAADLMVPGPVVISHQATLQEAVVLLTDNRFSALPVVDDVGRPVGVLSQSDILRHDRVQADAVAFPHYYSTAELTLHSGERLPKDFLVGEMDKTLVYEMMSPVVYSVRPETPIAVVVEEMVALAVHRLFVVDHDEKLIGVISTMDILAALKA